MTSYINRLIVTMVICQIATVLSPENGRRYVRTVCALVVLLTLIGPIVRLSESVTDAGEYVKDMLDTSAAVLDEEKFETSANMIFTYAAQHFSVSGENIRITFVTDESGEVCEIQIFLKNCPYAARKEIGDVTEKEFGIVTHVFAEDALHE